MQKRDQYSIGEVYELLTEVERGLPNTELSPSIYAQRVTNGIDVAPTDLEFLVQTRLVETLDLQPGKKVLIQEARKNFIAKKEHEKEARSLQKKIFAKKRWTAKREQVNTDDTQGLTNYVAYLQTSADTLTHGFVGEGEGLRGVAMTEEGNVVKKELEELLYCVGPKSEHMQRTFSPSAVKDVLATYGKKDYAPQFEAIAQEIQARSANTKEGYLGIIALDRARDSPIWGYEENRLVLYSGKDNSLEYRLQKVEGDFGGEAIVSEEPISTEDLNALIWNLKKTTYRGAFSIRGTKWEPSIEDVENLRK